MKNKPFPQGWQDWTAAQRSSLSDSERLAWATHAGELHATCSHGPPPDYCDDEIRAYETSQLLVLSLPQFD